MQHDSRSGARHRGRMEYQNDDDLLLDAVHAIVIDALARIGNEPQARY